MAFSSENVDQSYDPTAHLSEVTDVQVPVFETRLTGRVVPEPNLIVRTTLAFRDVLFEAGEQVHRDIRL